MIRCLCIFSLALGLAAQAAAQQAGDRPKSAGSWPLFGGTPTRNMVNLIDRNVPVKWNVEAGKEENIKWKANLGSKSYSGPVVAGGRIFIGTNNPKARDENKDHQSVLMCLREADGKPLWEIRHPAPEGEIYDHVHNMGLLSTPVVDGDRVFYVLPQCVVICAGGEDGKILWKYDMGKELKVVPYHCGNCSPLVAGNLLFLVTGNGVDEQTEKVRDKSVPSFIAIHKDTGKLAWQNSLPGDRVIDGQWSNPAYAVIQGKPQVIFPGGDAVLYSFEPETGKLIWKCACQPKNPPKKAKPNDGRPCIIATPVIHDSKVYVGLGVYPGGHPKPPRYSHFLCIDATRTGDVSPLTSLDPKEEGDKNFAILWSYGGPVDPADKGEKDRSVHFGSSISTCAIHNGLIYLAEEAGYIHCLDAATGKKYWMHDLGATVWGSPYYVDGKVYLCTEEGNVVIFQAGKQYKEIAMIDMGEQAFHGTPVVVNGVLYIATRNRLFAIAEKK
jgi:outer membrane protein assembly factor BamB